MRHYLTRVALCLLPASLAWGQAPVLVQQTANSGSELSSLSLTLPQLPTPGNLLVVSHDVTSSSNSTLSGGGVTTWTLCATSIPTKSNSEIWAGIVSSSPSRNITITLGSNPNYASGCASEWSGVAPPLVFDGVANSGSGSTITTGSVTVNANDLVIATTGTHGDGQTILPPGSGFTDLARSTPQNSSTMATSYKIPTAAGSASTSWGLGYSHSWANAIVVFHIPDTGGGGTGGGGTGGGGTGGGGTGGGGTGGGGTGGGGTGGATALVQQAVNAGSGLSNLALTLPQMPVSGNVIVLSHDSTSGGDSRVTGGGVDTWVLCATSIPAQDNSEIWAGVVGNSPSRSINLRLGGSPNAACVVATEWSGLATPLSFTGRATNGSGGASSSSPVTTSSLSVNANDVVIATVGIHGGGETIHAPSNGFTDLPRPASQSSSVMAAAYLLPTAAGSASTSWTLGYNHLWAAAIVVFRAP